MASEYEKDRRLVQPMDVIYGWISLARNPSIREERAVESLGYKFYPVEPVSLEDLLQTHHGYFAWVHKSRELRQSVPSHKNTLLVGIKPQALVVPHTHLKSQQEQWEAIQVNHKQTGVVLSGCQEIMPPPSWLVQLDIRYQQEGVLLPSFYARAWGTIGLNGADSIAVGRRHQQEALRVDSWGSGYGYREVVAVSVLIFM